VIASCAEMQEFTIIWLDINSSDPNNNFRLKLGEVQTFTNPNDCIEYLQCHPNELIYLIISDSFAKTTIPQIYDYANLIQIFLFCGTVAAYSEWGLDYCEKLFMFDHEDDLLARLWKDFEIKLREQAEICLERADEFKQRALRYKQPSCG
jgi:hypothetical protein